MEDFKKIDLLRDGDIQTYKKFFCHYYPVMMSFACRFVDRQTAEDLVQDTFIMIWEERKNLVIQNIFSFLLRSLQNKCLNYLKHKLVIEEYETYVRIAEVRMEYIMERSDENQIYFNLNKADLHKKLKDALLKLPPKCAETCDLYYFQGYSAKEIATIMGVSSRTVEGYIYQAIKFLREELQGTDFLSVVPFLQIMNFLK